jgi:hypothetical protein
MGKLLFVFLVWSAAGVAGQNPDPVKVQTYNQFTNEFERFSLGKVGSWAAPSEEDKVENLVDGSIIKSIFEMEKSLKAATLEKQPWSDSYWPMARGLIGNRYADGGFPDGFNWSANFNYIQSHNAWNIYSSGGSTDALAPSEKYDLLVGDSTLSLTRTAWAKGQYYFQTYGVVESWMGLCHGWAPASYMYPTPEHSIVVTSPSGRPIRFYPSDVKALASLAWGTTGVKPKFVGVKCKERYPKYDENGRLMTEYCLDSNAATWHVGIVSQLGLNKRSLVMDATYNYEVWNHSIISYDYKYFNPQTLEPSNRLGKSLMPIARITGDKFKKYRHPDTHSVVGVEMTVTYNAPLRSNHAERQSNLTKTVIFVYDLELDANGDIIGGEWHTNNHPDFLWTPISDSRPLSIADVSVNPGEWTGVGPVPESWASAARTASMKSGQPLAALVDALVALSNAPETVPEGNGGP